MYFNKVTAAVLVSLLKVSTAILIFNPVNLTVDDSKGTTEFTISLSAPPSNNAPVYVYMDSANQLHMNPCRLMFTPYNYYIPQNVSVLGIPSVIAYEPEFELPLKTWSPPLSYNSQSNNGYPNNNGFNNDPYGQNPFGNYNGNGNPFGSNDIPNGNLYGSPYVNPTAIPNGGGSNQNPFGSNPYNGEGPNGHFPFSNPGSNSNPISYPYEYPSKSTTSNTPTSANGYYPNQPYENGVPNNPSSYSYDQNSYPPGNNDYPNGYSNGYPNDQSPFGNENGQNYYSTGPNGQYPLGGSVNGQPNFPSGANTQNTYGNGNGYPNVPYGDNANPNCETNYPNGQPSYPYDQGNNGNPYGNNNGPNNNPFIPNGYGNGFPNGQPGYTYGQANNGYPYGNNNGPNNTPSTPNGYGNGYPNGQPGYSYGQGNNGNPYGNNNGPNSNPFTPNGYGNGYPNSQPGYTYGQGNNGYPYGNNEPNNIPSTPNGNSTTNPYNSNSNQNDPAPYLPKAHPFNSFPNGSNGYPNGQPGYPNGNPQPYNYHDHDWNYPVTRQAGPALPSVVYGDPHLNTYDGAQYTSQQIGTYYYLLSVDGRVAIQAHQFNCIGANSYYGTCMDSVAIQYGNLVSVISTTDVSNNLTMTSNMDPSQFNVKMVMNSAAGIYSIEFPDGTNIKISHHSEAHSFIDLDIKLSSVYRYRVKGLLGTFDNDTNPYTQLTFNGTSVNIATQGGIDEFVSSYVVPENLVLTTTSHVPQPSESEYPFLDGYALNGPANMCQIPTNQQFVAESLPSGIQNMCSYCNEPMQLNMGVPTQMPYNDQYNPSPISNEFPKQPCAASQKVAMQICQNIANNQQCNQYLNASIYIKNCFSDVMTMGSLKPADSARNAYARQCNTFLQGIALQQGSIHPTQTVTSGTCNQQDPNACSGNGLCSASGCKCFGSFTGSKCTVNNAVFQSHPSQILKQIQSSTC